MKDKRQTSWGDVSEWYDQLLEDKDSYQANVILPNVRRIVSIQSYERLLDLACGQGFFTREFAKTGALCEGTDISEELILLARKKSPEISFHVAPADNIAFAPEDSYDVITCILALQNIENLSGVCTEAARVLKKKLSSRFVVVLNHPAFRIPKQSSWQWDEKTRTQYRRIDRYLSPQSVKIDMEPGKKGGDHAYTYSYHRSLQDYMKALRAAGFFITRLEEWISHKKSQEGPRSRAEDAARKEFPLFMMLELKLTVSAEFPDSSAAG